MHQAEISWFLCSLNTSRIAKAIYDSKNEATKTHKCVWRCPQPLAEFVRLTGIFVKREGRL